MIQVPRVLCRQLWNVFRRCFRKSHVLSHPILRIQSGEDGLTIRLAHVECSFEYRQPGPCPSGAIDMPLEALADIEGRGQDLVTLESSGVDRVVARWQDAGIPRLREYQILDREKQPVFPAAMPERIATNPSTLLQALDDAVHTASNDGGRYSTNRLLLRGTSGEVVGTDGKQLLVQRGFEFPWTEDVLVPNLPIFACKELGQDLPLEVGRTDKDVILRVGPWTLFLLIDTTGRYPNIENYSRVIENGTCVHIAPEDAVFLARTLAHLPGQDDLDRPITVDLDRQVQVRARADQGRVTEAVLTRSTFTGKRVRFCMNRVYLAHALQLGLGEIHVRDPEHPVIARDERRTYVFMPLPKSGALAPAADALRIISAETEKSSESSPPIFHERTNGTMSENDSKDNGHAETGVSPSSNGHENGTASLGTLIGEAQALRDFLGDGYARASRLVTAIKRHRKQSDLVRTTLSNLRQLHKLDV